MSITSANAVFMISIPGVFPTPVQIQGFATDDVFDSEQLTLTQSVIGIDGKKSTGFVFELYGQNITLQADSQSFKVFDAWAAAMRVAREDYPANATIVLTATNQSFTLTNGSLESYTPVPDGKKVLQPRKYKITWESVTPSVI